MSIATEAIEKAKAFISFESEIIGKVESSVYPAAQELKVLLGLREYCRFYNSQQNATVSKVEDAGNGYSRIFVSPYNIKKFDNVLISGTTDYDGCFEVFNENEDTSSFTIQSKFKVSRTGFVSNELFETYKVAYAWLICYYTTFAIQELKKDKVLLTSEQFGEGDIKTFSISDIIKQREEYLRNAHLLLGKTEIRKS